MISIKKSYFKDNSRRQQNFRYAFRRAATEDLLIMHELSIAENILKALYDIKAKENLNKITKVNVKAGSFLHIVPDSLNFAFEAIKKDTEFKDAILDFEIESVKIECSSCNGTFDSNEYVFSCPNCGSEEIKISGTKDFIITSIDAE